MRYDVYLDDIELYGVTTVTEDSDRDITTYDGLGQGNFPVPESKGLRSWVIECELSNINDFKHGNWTSAKQIFKELESLLSDKSASRLVINSDNVKLSERALIESYTKREKYSGVYEVSIKLTEYKAAAIKTTDVPYIPRPGKVPTPPSTKTYNNSTDVSTDIVYGPFPQDLSKDQTYTYYWPDGKERIKYTNNPNVVPLGPPVRTSITEYANQGYKPSMAVAAHYQDNKGSFQAMSNAIDEWFANTGKSIKDSINGKKEWR